MYNHYNVQLYLNKVSQTESFRIAGARHFYRPADLPVPKQQKMWGNN